MSDAEAAAEIVNAIVAEARKGECVYCHGEILSKARDDATPEKLKPYLKESVSYCLLFGRWDGDNSWGRGAPPATALFDNG
ncbi:MAG: hypothetical protein NUV80_05345, partial [Candidatus Berkelbacteria bacterium]|nr:hypothetical protein [Candidatus Berkelbacteria bacterium]